jgi:putative spermidine/putrescine transport system ATP-binding protein
MGSPHEAIGLIQLSKTFGSVTAVDNVDLSISDGEFFSMLGPSGSGKTTVLRMIAGFAEPTSGKVLLDGADMTGRPPHHRDVNTVFQDYALFPHMDVITNIEYGLRVKGVAKAARRARAAASLESVQLTGFEKRRPSELSGGQRQRVALARALVNQPKVLLLDEPLGALDLKLRREMQLELKEIQRKVGITFVFVTHDQEEALTMSDRIAVFNAGRIEQVATPHQLYESPATSFVAGFVGTSNLLAEATAKQVVGRDGVFSIRPEKIHFAHSFGAPSEGYRVKGVVTAIGYLGSVNHYQVEVADGTILTVMQQNAQADGNAVTQGDRVELAWAEEHLINLTPPRDAPAVSPQDSPPPGGQPPSDPAGSTSHKKKEQQT